MMMGTAGELPKAPPKPVQFLEDMTDAEVMNAVSRDRKYELRIIFFKIINVFIVGYSSWIREPWKYLLHGKLKHERRKKLFF
jgi:hypothetical protein